MTDATANDIDRCLLILPLLMAEEADQPDQDDGGGVAEPPPPPAKPKKKGQTKSQQKPKPKRPPTEMLPPWKVLLHNDDVNTFEDVIDTIVELTPLDENAAVKAAREADAEDVSLLLVTHKERAELYVDQFKAKFLTVTIEPAE